MALPRRFWQFGVLVALVFATGAGSAAAAPKADLWARWQAHVPGAAATIDHSPWAAFLARYVAPDAEGVNRVAYGAVSVADRRVLDGYLARLAALPISRYDRPEQMAYWLNLYNALTVQIVLAHYPVETIRDIDLSPGLLSDGPWDAKLIEVEGEALSLDDIEHRILRPIWHDPRVHYALNCAALGCPNLQPEPFAGARLDDQLERAARAYVNDPRGISLAGSELTVSALYDWYEDDFGGSESAVLEHLRIFAAPLLARRLAPFTAIDRYRYDWRLNDAERRRAVKPS